MTEVLPPAVRRASGSAAAWLGMVAVGVAVTMLGLLHVLPPSSALDPARRTISQYALLDNGWVFDAAVLLLAGGSLSILVALLGVRLLDGRPGAVAALLLWCVSLVAVVYFQKHNWAVGPSIDGHIHRVASVVAFLSLPVAALISARGRTRDPASGRYATATLAAGVVALLCFVPIVVAYLAQPWTGVAWWRAIPLGGVERALGLGEIAVILCLGWWAARTGRHP
ncbi:MAG TPA: DUF998 domain-containing protein [Actinoplanes sp.]